MRVITIKLTNGEEWVAKHQEAIDDESFYTLKSVRKLHIVNAGGKSPGLMLSPVLLGNIESEDFILEKRHIMLVAQLDATLEKQYLQQVSHIALI